MFLILVLLQMVIQCYKLMFGFNFQVICVVYSSTLAPEPEPWWPGDVDPIHQCWLSGGSVRPDVVHRLLYKLAHDVCVVHSISLEVAECHQVQLIITVLTSAV